MAQQCSSWHNSHSGTSQSIIYNITNINKVPINTQRQSCFITPQTKGGSVKVWSCQIQLNLLISGFELLQAPGCHTELEFSIYENILLSKTHNSASLSCSGGLVVGLPRRKQHQLSCNVFFSYCCSAAVFFFCCCSAAVFFSCWSAAVFCNVFFYPQVFAAVCVPAIRLVSLMFSELVMREHYHTWLS